MQCNVTWQTISGYRRLTVPSGRNLNYISFVRKIQIPEVFGTPLVHCLSCKAHTVAIKYCVPVAIMKIQI
jgi:hypothetical protein